MSCVAVSEVAHPEDSQRSIISARTGPLPRAQRTRAKESRTFEPVGRNLPAGAKVQFMITIIAATRSNLGPYAVSDAKDKAVRYHISVDAELDRARARDYLVLLDGLGSISMAFTLLRLLVEADTPRRLAIFGETPDISRLIDAWERSRLDELSACGRLTMEPQLDDSRVLALAAAWAQSIG
jgi:hypothetical protein